MEHSEIYNKIKRDKFKITHWNKDLIEMKTFLSFLTIDVELIKEHLGASTGWTKYNNQNINLIIKGGVFNGVEYLESLEYGKKLSNVWNNYVNPFYLFDILNRKGQRFFLDYYKDEINEAIKEQSIKVKQASEKYKRLKNEKSEIVDCFSKLESSAL